MKREACIKCQNRTKFVSKRLKFKEKLKKVEKSVDINFKVWYINNAIAEEARAKVQ